MSMTRVVVGMLWLGLMIFGAGTVSSQTYPNKPLRFVTTPVGGPGDITARLIAPGISVALGQPVIVENRPFPLIPEIMAKAPPDGYSFFTGGAALWIGPLLQKMPYDPVRDFTGITLTTTSPDILVVNPSLPVNSVKELIALAKTKPGELNYAASSTGGSAHLAGELLKSLAGVDIVRVSYKGTAPQISALIAGEVHLVFASPSGVESFLNSGKLKALAIASAQPSARYPGLPTVASSLPGFEPASATALFAPARTPVSIINQLNREIVRVLNQPDVKEKLFNAGLDIVGSSPQEVMAMIKSDVARMGKVIKDAGIKVE